MENNTMYLNGLSEMRLDLLNEIKQVEVDLLDVVQKINEHDIVGKPCIELKVKERNLTQLLWLRTNDYLNFNTKQYAKEIIS